MLSIVGLSDQSDLSDRSDLSDHSDLSDFDYKQEQEQLVAKRWNALSTEIAQKFTK